jgi:hypothetical protein
VTQAGRAGSQGAPGMVRSQLGKTTGSVSSYWAL